MRIYSTLSETKEPLPENRPLKLFVCGPTVYDYPHIGNARTFMAFDLFVRFLRNRGVEVDYLQNITDVDDKIIARAAEDGTTWEEVARKFEDIFHGDLKSLGIDSVSTFARATDHIPEIVTQVQTLIEKGHVYKIENDGWYFDLTTFPDYGKLAHRTLEQAEDGVSRIDESDKKKNKGDFCVWKFTPANAGPAEPSWDTPLGTGRPGWHIEDTAITEKYFGPQYDIHGGAIDLKFPHHEAEIAQQESSSGKKPLANIWMHAGFLLVGGEKMSKSKGNFIVIEDLLKKYSARTFRMAVFMHHYRSPMDWTEDLAAQAEKNISSLALFRERLLQIANEAKGARVLDAAPYEAAFEEALADDFMSPRALAALFEMMSEANKDLWSLSSESARGLAECIGTALQPLGFELTAPQIPENVAKLAEEREEMRRNKQFIQADELRAKIEALGYRSEDTPLGAMLWPK
jgi:cysteinyl-tRNA synthetase